MLSSCKKEIKVENSESDLVFEPYGKDVSIKRSLSTNNFIFNIIDRFEVFICNEKQQVKNIFHTNNDILKLVPVNNGEVIGVTSTYDGLEKLQYFRLDKFGNKIYESSVFDKLVTLNSLNENLISACSDAKGGVYVMVYCHDGLSPSISEDRYLVHINSQNSIDKITPMYDFVVYMASDDKGELYIGRTYGPEGDFMKIEIYKPDMNALNAGSVQKSWYYRFTNLERDWKWKNYFPYKMEINKNKLYLIMSENTGQNDLATGLRYRILNISDGKEANTFVIPFGISINNYLNISTFEPIFVKDEHFLAFNYGTKSKVVQVNDQGEILFEQKISGPSNRSFLTGVSYLNGYYNLAGYMTLNTSPEYVPFTFTFAKK